MLKSTRLINSSAENSISHMVIKGPCPEYVPPSSNPRPVSLQEHWKIHLLTNFFKKDYYSTRENEKCSFTYIFIPVNVTEFAVVSELNVCVPLPSPAADASDENLTPKVLGSEGGDFGGVYVSRGLQRDAWPFLSPEDTTGRQRPEGSSFWREGDHSGHSSSSIRNMNSTPVVRASRPVCDILLQQPDRLRHNC